MDEKQLFCDHPNITNAGICTSCGVDITSQEFIDSLPEAPEDLSYLGDLMGIIRLAQETAHEYLKRSKYAEPKFRWVGTQLIRSCPEGVWADVLEPSFLVAKTLGYRADYERWAVVCKEYAENISS
jgi:hypothetical protein